MKQRKMRAQARQVNRLPESHLTGGGGAVGQHTLEGGARNATLCTTLMGIHEAPSLSNVPVLPAFFSQPPPFPKLETHTPSDCTIQGRGGYRTTFSISSSAANASVCW